MGKIVYSWVIRRDSKIPGTVVRSSTIPEQLGRISYLLTDKTGEPPGAHPAFKVTDGARMLLLCYCLHVLVRADHLVVAAMVAAEPHMVLLTWKAAFWIFI